MRRPAIFAQHCRLAGAIAFGLVLGPGAAEADAPALERLIRVDRERCPSAAQIAAETWELTPPHRRAVLDQLTRVEVEQRGETYRIVVSTRQGSTARVFSRSDRDCQKRARVAAVIIVVILIPPDGSEEPPTLVDGPPPAAPPAPADRVPEPAPPRSLPRPLVRVELSGILDQAPSLPDSAPTMAFGGRLEGSFGRGAWVPALGLFYLPRAAFELEQVKVRLARVGATAALRGRTDLGPCNLAVELGVVLERARVEGETLTAPGSDAGMQLGVRAAALLALPNAARLQPFVGVAAQLFPEPHALVALPRGVIGTLPPLWLGASVGVALAL